MNREGLVLDEEEGRRSARQVVQPTARRQHHAAGALETGFKDTVVALPGQVTRVRAQFPTPGQLCGTATSSSTKTTMMRPYRIGPVQVGQPPDPEHG